MKFRTRLIIGIVCVLLAVLISVGSSMCISRISRHLLQLLENTDDTQSLQSFWEKCVPLLGMTVNQSDVDNLDVAIRKLRDVSSEEKTEILSEITALLYEMRKRGEPELGFFF